MQLGLGLSGCTLHQSRLPQSALEANQSVATARVAESLRRVRNLFAPDPHMMVFDISTEDRDGKLVLTGETSDTNALRTLLSELNEQKIDVQNEIHVLPGPELGERTWGIVSLSVANGREAPDHKAELGTQGLMGRKVRILKERRRWLLVQTEDRYLSWMESGAIARCTGAEAEAWGQSSLIIVTNYESRVSAQAVESGESVSDVVMGNLVKQTGEEGAFLRVVLPDGRAGFLQKTEAEDYTRWKKLRQPTAGNIERTARLFLGRPYLWGGNSPKAMDCSGFCKLVFLMNGVELNRNASEQARQGREVPFDENFNQLRKGDLLFFGPSGRRPRAEPMGAERWITHVGIYLGERKFVQSSERVRVSSLDPAASDYDEFHGRSLLFARRLLNE